MKRLRLDEKAHADLDRANKRIRELEAAVEHNAQIGAEMTREAHRQESRAEKAEARVAKLDAILEEWLETPYFERLLEWQEWVDDFRPRVIEAREREVE